MIESAEWMPETFPGQMRMIKTMIDGREWFVPDDMQNRDRQDIEAWVEAGNQIAPAESPETQPAKGS
jgi:hypothetical protein